MIKPLKIIAALLCLLSFVSCETKQPDINWNFSKSEITGTASSNTEKISVDVYLDVTTSMKGFVSASPTAFSKLLDDIEATCQNIWKNTDIQFFKFGRSVKNITRSEFVMGKTSVDIYSDPTLSTQTNFDEAVKNTNPKRVSILITDLFYNNNDVNLVVNAVKTQCFQKSVEAGIIGLESNFNGIVADVQPPVTVKGTRPVYMIVFGDKQNIKLFIQTFRNKPYIKPSQILLVTNKPTESYEVTVTKNPKSKGFNVQSLKKEWKDYGNIANFTMAKDASEASFNLAVTLSTNPYVFPFTEKNIKPVVFMKTTGLKDSIPADDKLSFQNVRMEGNTYKADIKLTNTGDAGNYSYLVYLAFDNTVTPVMPKWIKETNAEVFAQGQNENKTLNLEKLLTDISVNHITYGQPKLAKFYINVRKK
ncbi:hypothetical protein [Foetidibacter luteolus]|uniref:hypothetical protein n=1 Tax=Foetidibacter luteolus TaxID=2608880 RepID=UPI00129BBFBB|nr:hypothetical protein [Foetidibacter luteolus]